MPEKKREGRYELILAFHNGWTPKKLIEKGYSRATVYKYNKHYKKAKEKFLALSS